MCLDTYKKIYKEILYNVESFFYFNLKYKM